MTLCGIVKEISFRVPYYKSRPQDPVCACHSRLRQQNIKYNSVRSDPRHGSSVVKAPGYFLYIWRGLGSNPPVVAFFLHVPATSAGYIVHNCVYIQSFPNSPEFLFSSKHIVGQNLLDGGPGVLICNRVHGHLFLLQFHIMSCRLGHPCHTSHSQKAEKLPDQVPSQKFSLLYRAVSSSVRHGVFCFSMLQIPPAKPTTAVTNGLGSATKLGLAS